MAVDQLTLERRRHFRMSFGLVLACLAGAIAVQNERGVFVARSLEDAFAGTAQAFAAIAPPQSIQLMSYGPPIYPTNDVNPLPRALAARVLNPPSNLPYAGPFAGPAGDVPTVSDAPGQDSAPPANPGGSNGFTPIGSPGAAPVGGVPGGGGGTPDTGGGNPGTDTPVETPGTGPGGNPGTGPGGTPGTGPGDTPGTPGTGPGDQPATPGNPVTPPVEGPVTVPPPSVPPPVIPPDEVPIVNPPVTPTPSPIPEPTPGPIPEPTPGPNPVPDVPPDLPPDGPPILPPDGPPVTAVPEPATWGMLILGFGMMGAMQRMRRRRPNAV